MNLSLHQGLLVSRALARLSAAANDNARKYVEDRLRPLRDVRDADVQNAIDVALDRYDDNDTLGFNNCAFGAIGE